MYKTSLKTFLKIRVTFCSLSSVFFPKLTKKMSKWKEEKEEGFFSVYWFHICDSAAVRNEFPQCKSNKVLLNAFHVYIPIMAKL